MVKRDRWASSSDEEDDIKEKEDKKNKHTIATQYVTCTKDGVIPKTTTKNRLPPLHNPLLMGCRLVYDTYDRIARISEGTYGIVWKARDLVTNEIVALKQIKFDDQQELLQVQGFPVTALREINVLMALSPHKNIVSVREMVVGNDNDKVFMVMEFMDTDLQEAIERRKYPNLLRQAELKGTMQQILKGVSYMHSKWFMHRDLKTSNILCHKSTGRVALCDFGLARYFQDPPGKNLTQLVVTLHYRAPELLFGETRYTPAVDIWSVGCIFGELIRQEAIMQGQGELDQIDKIFTLLGAPSDESWPEFKTLPNAKIFRWRSSSSETNSMRFAKVFPVNPPPHCKHTFLDTNGRDLLYRLLTLDPTKRISAKAALEHCYFTEGIAPTNPNFFDDNM